MYTFCNKKMKAFLTGGSHIIGFVCLLLLLLQQYNASGSLIDSENTFTNARVQSSSIVLTSIGTYFLLLSSCPDEEDAARDPTAIAIIHETKWIIHAFVNQR